MNTQNFKKGDRKREGKKVIPYFHKKKQKIKSTKRRTFEEKEKEMKTKNRCTYKKK